MALAERETRLGRESVPAEEMASRLADTLLAYEGIDDLFVDEAFFDINIPQFRFQVEGADAFYGWLKTYAPHGYRISLIRALPTASGFIAEVEGEYEQHGQELFFRNLYVCDVEGGRISEVSFWCTGDWDEQARAHWRHHAPMIRMRVS